MYLIEYLEEIINSVKMALMRRTQNETIFPVPPFPGRSPKDAFSFAIHNRESRLQFRFNSI